MDAAAEVLELGFGELYVGEDKELSTMAKPEEELELELLGPGFTLNRCLACELFPLLSEIDESACC
jgi:hypothetical protein